MLPPPQVFLANGEMRPVWDQVGVLRFTSGDRYAGELDGNQPSGYGVGTFAGDQKIVFEGQWILGREHGWGVVSNRDGTTLAGDSLTLDESGYDFHKQFKLQLNLQHVGLQLISVRRSIAACSIVV